MTMCDRWSAARRRIPVSLLPVVRKMECWAFAVAGTRAECRVAAPAPALRMSVRRRKRR